MLFHDFIELDALTVANIVREHGPRVVVCPINGTRRWFELEYGDQQSADYLDITLRKYMDIFTLFFTHGVETVLSPILGSDILARGPEYMQMVVPALSQIADGEMFRQFYQGWDVRVKFYGEYADYFAQNFPGLATALAQAKGALNGRRRLFWGMFASDPAAWISQFAVQHYAKTGAPPNREQVVAEYYGETVPMADMFIGSGPPTAFDYPLLDAGATALYFLQAPTPYLTQTGLRSIFFDYLYTRRVGEDYSDVPETEWAEARKYYNDHADSILGVGKNSSGGHFWFPV